MRRATFGFEPSLAGPARPARLWLP
jgi:hypothetical protein